MIRVKRKQNSALSLYLSTTGLTVFLDLWAIKELAKGDPARRKRFVAALRRGADLLFSVSNAAELSGALDGSFKAMKGFLNELGPRWFPVELDPLVVIGREKEGKPADKCCFSDQFLKDFLASRLTLGPMGQVVGLSPELFALGHVMDWLAPQRDSIARGRAQLDAALIERIEKYRAKHDADSAWLDRVFPAIRFSRPFAATFAYVNLVRALILESKSWRMMPGDGIDFCQAVIGSAFSNYATLDKKWKRRIEALPKPNKMARLYYSPELDAMVDDIEAALDRLAVQRGRAIAASDGEPIP